MKQRARLRGLSVAGSRVIPGGSGSVGRYIESCDDEEDEEQEEDGEGGASDLSLVLDADRDADSGPDSPLEV